MKKMQAMQPELAALKEKYKDDPRKMQEKNLELMKKHGVNPAAGCLPMLIQFPVFIGFVFMVRTAIELRGESFLWASDLSQPDTLFNIPFIGLPFNLFPLLMMGSSLWVSSLTPPSPQMDPAQQRMIRYMPIMFVVFFYNNSSGLTLYWTVQNLISVLQTKITQRSRAKSDDASKAVVTTPVARRKK
jgi:YidC/Oxa1 family membrane protein insertase